MHKKKVTLSLDSKVYGDFKDYCEKNAIMLSKKVELIMKDILTKKKMYIFLFFMLTIFSAYGLVFNDSASGFSNGAFQLTFLNGSFVQINNSFNGNYSSEVFDAGINANWNNISWISGYCYGCQLPNNASNETGFILANTWMNGNVLLLHMNEGVANSGPLGTDVQDFSGQGNNANETNGVVFGANGKFDRGLTFDGVNDRLQVPDSSSLDILNNITMEFWINSKTFNHVNNGPDIISKGTGYDYAVFIEENGQVFFALDSSSNFVSSNRLLNTNTWYHIVAVREGNTRRLYIDGVLDNSDSFTGTIDANNMPLYIGGTGSGSSQPFNGSLDEIAIYNRPLNATEVRDRYLRGTLKLNLSLRTCDDPNCSGESFIDFNDSSSQNLGLNGRYFQYKFEFSSENSTFTPQLYNVSMDYSITNNAPAINIIYPTRSNYTSIVNSLNYSVSDSNDNLAGCWYSLNGGVTNFSVTCGVNVSGLNASQGNNTWRVYANDSLGLVNLSSTTFFVDSILPNISFVSPTESNNSMLTRANIIVNTSSQDTNFANLTVRLYNSTGLVNSTSTNVSRIYLNFTSLADGVYSFNASALDIYGNVNSTDTRIVTIDRLAPSIYIASPRNLNYTNSTILVNITSDGQNVWFYNGTANETYTVPVYRTFAQGGNVLLAYANDSGGNYNQTSVSFFVDSIPPSFTSIPANGSIVYGQAFGVDFDASGVASYYVDLPTFSINQSGFLRNATSLAAGSYVMTVSANDSFGNINQTNYQIDVNKTSATLLLYLNNSQSNLSTHSGQSIWINATLSSSSYPLGISINGEVVNFGFTSLANFTTFSTVGEYNVTAFSLDSQNYSGSSISLFVTTNQALDLRAPDLSINSPQNLTYLVQQTGFNFSVHDVENNLASCWYNVDSGSNQSFSCSEGYNVIPIISHEGNNTWRVYANDSSGNMNSSSVAFFVDTGAPVVNLISPSSGQTFGTNMSIPLQYSAVDLGSGVQSCSYSLNGGVTNVSLISCQNSSFNVSGSGNYIITVYAIDSLGFAGSTSNSFSVHVDAPAINLIYPSDGVYLTNNSVNLSYSVIDSNLQTCALYGDFDGVYGVVQTVNAVSGTSSFNVTGLNEDIYHWAVSCNNSFGYSSTTGNRTFHIDMTPPRVELIAPRGTYNSLTQIPLTFDVDEENIANCWYNVSLIDSNALSNVVITDCESTSFSVGAFGNYKLNLMVNDSAANLDKTNTTFIVTPPTSNPPAQSSGGGGGGPSIPAQAAKLAFEGLDPLELRRGESKIVGISVKNVGSKFLNNCGIGIVEFGSTTELERGIAPGQVAYYEILVSVPRDAEPGLNEAQVTVSCDEASLAGDLKIDIPDSNFDFFVLDARREETRLVVTYSVKNFLNEKQSIDFVYRLINSEGTVVYDGKESAELEPFVDETRSFSFELPKDSIGEFSLSFEVSNDEEVVETEKSVILPRIGLAGFAVSESNRRTIAGAGATVAIAFVLFFLIRVIYLHYRPGPPKHRHRDIISKRKARHPFRKRPKHH